MSGVGSVANYIFVARSDRVFEIGEIEVGPRWVVGVVFVVVVGDHDDDDDDARSLGRSFCSFSMRKWWWSFPLLFVLGRQRRMNECWLGRVNGNCDGK